MISAGLDRVEAVNVRLMIDIERFDLHREDGYGSVASMFRHHACLSRAEARTRYQSAKMCLALPEVEKASRAGQIPSDNMRQLGSGNARAAVKLASTTCVWPSCHVPTSKCETDHVVEHSKRGKTNPGNGAPLCGKHNRWKQKGFTVWRDAQSNWHTYRPDGSEIDP